MHIVIIGNGISGVTAARHLRKKSQHEITIVSGESEFHYSRPALMYSYMGHMRKEDLKPYEDWFWEKNRISLKNAWVESIDFTRKQLTFVDGSSMDYDKLVLAVGSVTSYYGWSGQDLDGVHGMVTLQDVEAMERHSDAGLKHAVIVGGGLIGIEMAECFHTRQIPVSFLVREKSYWNRVLPPDESAMVTQHIHNKHGIDLRLETELSEIWGDGKGKGKVKVAVAKGGEKFPCEFVGISAGVKPNIEWLNFSDLELGRGIMVNDHLETNIKDVYAIGDCAELRTPQPGRRPIEAIWYTGRMMGETAAYNILGEPTPYRPGIFFNSAKFFDLEYQVYGSTPSVLPEGQKWFYWQHPTAEKAVRLYWDEKTNAVLGFHVMGIRYRHDVCEKWIANSTHINEVVEHLGLANFDPEFYKEHEADVVSAFNAQEGTSIKLATRRGLSAVQRFLKKLTSKSTARV
ncbi:MAG: NAD(P)/FAD-dependent oxidoreductase [Saprospiraceae bacterium]